MNELSCMNCKKQVLQQDAKIFASVYVCSSCYDKAERIYAKCEAELRRLLLMLREAIRIALVEGRLQFAEGKPLEEVPKAELLKMIVELSGKKEKIDAASSGPPRQPPLPRPPGR